MRVLDVVQRIKGVLVGPETVLQIVDEQVAVAERGPGRPVHRVDRDDLEEVLDGLLVVAVRRGTLSHTIDSVDTEGLLPVLGHLRIWSRLLGRISSLIVDLLLRKETRHRRWLPLLRVLAARLVLSLLAQLH